MPMRPFALNNPQRKLFAPPPGYVDVRVLAAGVAERHTVPSGARFVIFGSNADFYAKFGDGTVTAEVPSGDITDGSAAEVNPEAREIPDEVTHISIVAPAATNVSLSFYSE